MPKSFVPISSDVFHSRGQHHPKHQHILKWTIKGKDGGDGRGRGGGCGGRGGGVVASTAVNEEGSCRKQQDGNRVDRPSTFDTSANRKLCDVFNSRNGCAESEANCRQKGLHHCGCMTHSNGSICVSSAQHLSPTGIYPNVFPNSPRQGPEGHWRRFHGLRQ